MLLLDAEPSRKERGHRGVRPRHPSRSAARRAVEGSSSGAGPRRFVLGAAVVFLLGFVALIVLCIVAVVQSMRSRRTSA